MADKEIRRCKSCGAEFVPYSVKQVYCSTACRTRGRYVEAHPDAKTYSVSRAGVCKKVDCVMYTSRYINRCKGLSEVPQVACMFYKSKWEVKND